MTKRIYLAGPLFTAAERAWNDRLAAALRGKGFEVVLPQEEATKYMLGDSIDFAGIFTTCLEGIRSMDVVVAVLDGVDVDSGTAFECGYAYAIGKPVIGIRTDLRCAGEEKGVNAMLSRCCQKLLYVPAFNDRNQLITSIVTALSALETAAAK